MTLQTINLGQNPNDGTGDPVRTAFGKTNQNIDELSTRTAAAQATADAAVPQAQKGAAGGVAPLGSDSRIPAAYLPSYVDDVLEFAGVASFPVVGEPGKIYVALDDNRIYRWSAQGYIELSPNPADTDTVSEGDSNLYFTQPRVITALTDNAEAARSALGVYSEGQTIPIFSANNIPLANVGSDIEVQGIGMMSWSAATNRYEMVHYQHGQCQFRAVSSTQCILAPYNGNGIVIDGRQYRIPASGISVGLTGLALTTNYYAYVYDNAGTLAIEFSVTAHSAATNGVEIKTGDPTRTLVGMVRMGGLIAFLDTTQYRGVLSWFNRKPAGSSASIDTNTTSTELTPLGNSPGCLFWSGELVTARFVGHTTNSGIATNFVAMYITGQGPLTSTRATVPAGGYFCGIASENQATVSSDVWITCPIYVATAGGTAYYVGVISMEGTK